MIKIEIYHQKQAFFLGYTNENLHNIADFSSTQNSLSFPHSRPSNQHYSSCLSVDQEISDGNLMISMNNYSLLLNTPSAFYFGLDVAPSIQLIRRIGNKPTSFLNDGVHLRFSHRGPNFTRRFSEK